MKWKLLIAALVTGGIGYAAWRFYKNQANLLQQYEIKPIRASVVKWSKEIITMRFTIRITNKSAIEAVMQRLYADIYLNDFFAGYVVNTSSAVIPAKGISDVDVEITASPQQLFKNIVSTVAALVQQKDISYRMKGYVKIKSSFIGASIPFDYSSTLKQELFSSVPINS